MSENGDYMDGYNDGFIDGRGTRAKPLRWRTGPVEGKPGEQYIVMDKYGQCHFGKLTRGFPLRDGDRYIPLSEILDLIGG